MSQIKQLIAMKETLDKRLFFRYVQSSFDFIQKRNHTNSKPAQWINSSIVRFKWIHPKNSFKPRSTLNILVIFYWNFLLGGSHLWPLSVNMSTSIIWCDSNKKVQYFSVWLWYTLCSPLMAYHHNDRLCEKVSWLLPNHIPIKLLFLFSTQLN